MSQIEDDSPNGLAPVNKVNVAKMSRWPLYAVMLAGLLMLAVLVYSVNFAHNPEEEEAKTKKVEIQETDKPLLMGDGQGLALKPPKEAVVTPPPPAAPVPSGKEPLIVVRDKAPEGNPYQQELDNIRRMKAQALLTALSSPISVQKAAAGGQDSAPRQGTATPAGRSAADGYQPSPASAYDVEADKDKESFFSRSQTRDTEWLSEGTRRAGQPLELKTGFVVPGVMITGVNSDLPGNLIAQVSQNVYDSATGRDLLIPQGSKLYGVYDSRVIYGQERVLVAWNRIIFPDGSAFTLGAMPGTDMAGNAGFTDEVNNHYLRIFGSAVLMSVIMGGTAYTMDSLNTSGRSNNNDNSVSMQDEMVSALAAQLGQTTTALLQKNLNIKPTVEIRPGYQFNIVVTKDLVFQEPYRPWKPGGY